MSSVLFSVDPSDAHYASKPNVDGAKILVDGKVIPWEGPSNIVTSPIIDTSTGERAIIGKIAHLTSVEAEAAVAAAKKAWNNGQGLWPQMTVEQRIAAIEGLVTALKTIRSDLVNVLQWEICKNDADAAAEFDRTVLFIEASIGALREASNEPTMTVSGVQAKVRRAAIGVMLALGPFNYPFNETYTTLIPALLMGNTVVMKIPTVGGLAHVLTMEAYASSLPPGVVNFVSGPGRETMGPAMEAGVDVFAFIGGSKAADALLHQHPAPHRLKVFLSLEGKNLGIVTADADINNAAEQILLGSTTFNGQRCTAIKMTFVHSSIADSFISKLTEKVAALKAGLPWLPGTLITPLPEPGKIDFLKALVDDALGKGAAVVNASYGGGLVYGNIFVPAIVAPVTENMRLWHEEQFGPVVPVAIYSDIAEVLSYVDKMPYGQQAAIFSTSETTIAQLVDVFSTVVGRININTQCGRSPDLFPFSGRRSSALGTLSVTEALRSFSIETVVAGKVMDLNTKIFADLDKTSKFLAPVALGK